MSVIIIFYICSFLTYQKPQPPSFYNTTKISAFMFCIMIQRSTIQHFPNTGWKLFDLQLPSASIALNWAWPVNALAETAIDSRMIPIKIFISLASLYNCAYGLKKPNSSQRHQCCFQECSGFFTDKHMATLQNLVKPVTKSNDAKNCMIHTAYSLSRY